MSTIVTGGHAVAGASIGILMLQSQFPRIPGDGGNAATWPFPVLFKVVDRATPERVVNRNADGLIDAFVDAGRELVRAGATGLTTSCGFMILHQQTLASRCEVPVATSSLLQVPMIRATLPPGKRIGIITVSSDALTHAHLEAAGIDSDTPVEGTESGTELSRVLLGNALQLNLELAREDVLAAAIRLQDRTPDLGAVVLECTNMPPYAAALSRHLKLPVYDFYSLVSWFHAGLQPRTFAIPDPC